MASNGESVGMGGSNRTVHIYDSKKWTVRGTWANVLKYEVLQLFSSHSCLGEFSSLFSQ